MFCQHWTIFSTLSRFPRDAAARVGAGRSLVCAASQQEAGLDGAEVKEGEVSAFAIAERRRMIEDVIFLY